MSVTTVTRFHAAAGQEATLLDLQSEGQRRMLAADGYESFDILRDQADPRAFAFVQTWSSREAHDAAFSGLIMANGHLEKVLAALDEGVVQTSTTYSADGSRRPQNPGSGDRGVEEPVATPSE
jgi:quinol monooxygenase YgiN